MDTVKEIDALLPWFFPVAAFVFGACWGSFLNVVIYRVPAGKSVIKPGSHCACGKPIPFYDNIPILTWFLRGGKARCCGRKFSFRYPFVELLTASLYAAAWLLLPPEQALGGFLFLALMIAATFIDLDTMTLPDAITIGGCITGVVLGFVLPGMHGYGGSEPFLILSLRSGVTALIGAAVGSGVILWIALTAEAVLKKEAMGFGDVILMGCIGAFCGWQGALFGIFGGALLGTVFIIPIMVMQKVFGISVAGPGKVVAAGKEGVSAALDKEDADKAAAEQAQNESATAGRPIEDKEKTGEQPQLGMGVAIPFGPWLALGGVVYYLYAYRYVDPYLESVSEMIFKPVLNTLY